MKQSLIIFVFMFLSVSSMVLAIDCQSGVTYSNPGLGNGCCYLGKYYQSQSLINEKTLVCVDGQWIDVGLNTVIPNWVVSSEVCKTYGEFSSISSGWYGPYAKESNYSNYDRYMTWGSPLGMMCGKDRFCNDESLCVANSNKINPKTGQTQPKEVFGFYFDWYDVGVDGSAYRICGQKYNESYGYRACVNENERKTCEKLSVIENTPIYGENSFINWNNKSLYKADFSRMKRAGIDVAVLVGWPGEEYDLGAITYINQGLSELEDSSIEFPKIVLFEALDNWIYHLFPGVDFYDDNSRGELIEKIVDRDVLIWNKLDDKYEFITNNGEKILWTFRPPVLYDSKINCKFYDELKETFNNHGEKVFIVAPSSSGNCDSIGAYHNWGQGNVVREDQSKATAPAKYISNKIDICEVSPGVERNNAKFCAGDYDIFSNFPNLERGSGEDFVKSWDYCIANNEGWIVVQTWNEYFESTNIAPDLKDGTKFAEINLTKANKFKGESINWKECEIDEECVIDGVARTCLANRCQAKSIVGDYDGNGEVGIMDFGVWKDKYQKGLMGLVDFGVWKREYQGR